MRVCVPHACAHTGRHHQSGRSAPAQACAQPDPDTQILRPKPRYVQGDGPDWKLPRTETGLICSFHIPEAWYPAGARSTCVEWNNAVDLDMCCCRLPFNCLPSCKEWGELRVLGLSLFQKPGAGAKVQRGAPRTQNVRTCWPSKSCEHLLWACAVGTASPLQP